MRLKKRYETEELYLCLSHRSLFRQVTAYYQKNREFLKPFDPERDEIFYTSGYQYRLLIGDEAAQAEDTAYRFWIMEKADPTQVIGTVCLSGITRGAFLSSFLGYKLDKAHGGRGYMTQAVRKVTQIGFDLLGLHRIEANVMPRNTPSLRVLQKVGYREEGLAKDYLKINGKWEDHIHMVLLNPKV